MIDRDKVIMLMGGSESLADKLITAFKEESRKQVPLIKDYFQAADWPMLSNAAHIMKTQAAYLGLDELSETSRMIEYAAKAEVVDREPLIDLIDTLEAQVRSATVD